MLMLQMPAKCKKCSVVVFVLGIYNKEFLVTALVRDSKIQIHPATVISSNIMNKDKWVRFMSNP